MTKKTPQDALLNQARFAADQLRLVADRAGAIGLHDLAGEFRSLANSAEFFRGELDRELAAQRRPVPAS